MTRDVTMPVRVELPSTGQVGQATAIEQSRAAAEVHAAVLVAQQCPRDMNAAIRQMEQSCEIMSLAERAFFRFRRGKEQVSGATVHLARELARCWGNIQYGVAELRRDDVAGESEMQAYAWDVQTNSRAATIFIVPHRRDTKDGVKPITDMRDVYENNANMAARRVRECIFAVLPPWFTESAKDICLKTVADGGKVPIEQRRAEVIKKFADLGVTEDDVVRKLGKTGDKWTPHDLAQLWVIGKSIQRGEVSRDDEFPPLKITAEDVTAARPAESTPDAGKPAEPARIPGALLAKIKTQLVACDVRAPADQRHMIGRIVGREIGSFADITADDGQAATELLVRAGHADDPANALDHAVSELESAREDT